METLPNETALNKYVISWTKLLSLFCKQVVLVTDGCLGIGRGSLRHSLATHNQRSESNRFPLPFPFPSKLYIMCMANLEEVCFVLSSFQFDQICFGAQFNFQYIPRILHYIYRHASKILQDIPDHHNKVGFAVRRESQ